MKIKKRLFGYFKSSRIYSLNENFPVYFCFVVGDRSRSGSIRYIRFQYAIYVLYGMFNRCLTTGTGHPFNIKRNPFNLSVANIHYIRTVILNKYVGVVWKSNQQTNGHRYDSKKAF